MIMSFTLLRILLIKTAKSILYKTLIEYCYVLNLICISVGSMVTTLKLLEKQLIVQCYSRTLPTAHKYSYSKIFLLLRMMSMYRKPRGMHIGYLSSTCVGLHVL